MADTEHNPIDLAADRFQMAIDAMVLANENGEFGTEHVGMLITATAEAVMAMTSEVARNCQAQRQAIAELNQTYTEFDTWWKSLRDAS